MRKTGLFLIVSVFMFGMTALGGEESVNYQNVIADYFKTDIETVSAISGMGVTDDDLAVIYYVSQKTGTSTKQLAEFRMRKESWAEINKVRGADATDFFILIMAEVKSKIYGPIFQKFEGTAEEKWKDISLSDEDIANLVNLKIISRYHGYSVFEVMAMRDMGKDFVRINSDVAKIKKELIKKEKADKKNKKAEKLAESEG